MHRRTFSATRVKHTMALCCVARCRFPTTHVTRGHRCGTCGAYGHGQMECGRPAMLARLRNQSPQASVVAVPCTKPGCTQPWLHTTEAHQCTRCGGRNTECTCNMQAHSVVLKCPHCRGISQVDFNVVVHTNAECTICFDAKPCVVFSGCRHANICADCALQLGTP